MLSLPCKWISVLRILKMNIIEIDSNREFTKSFWQPDQDKCSFSLERIHLFPNLNYNGNLKHEDSNKDHDYSERSCTCLQNSFNAKSQREDLSCSLFTGRRTLYDGRGGNFVAISQESAGISSSMSVCHPSASKNIEASYPDVTNLIFNKLLSNETSLSCNADDSRNAILVKNEDPCKTLPLGICQGINYYQPLENKTKSSKSYVKELLNDKKSFLLVSLAVFIIGIASGLIAGLGILTGFRRRIVRCGEEDVVCLPHGCVSRSIFCSGTLKCKNLLDHQEDICIVNSESAKDVWNELQKENFRNTVTHIIPQKFEVPNKDEGGWVFYSNGSSNGSKYIVINKPLTFYGAQDHCRKLGGHLAHVNSIKEQIFLEEFLSKELQNGEQHHGSIGFWLGARRPRGGHAGSCMFDQWKWVDSYGRSHGAIKGFTAFMPGKPDNTYSPEECLYLAHNKGNDENKLLKWDDAPCDLHTFGGIKSLCEVELP